MWHALHEPMSAEPYLHTGLVADPICKLHQPGFGHPECPDRYDAIYDSLCRTGLMDRVRKIPARPAAEEELELCHVRDYIELVEQEAEMGMHTLSTGDADICPKSYEAALYAVGGVLNACDAVMEQRVQNAFCLVRPPGHHATADQGMGFCLFNNVALGARHVQRRHGIGRVLIVDWDLHHGNGTQAIFYNDPSVFYFSTHQAPLYPGTGFHEEKGMHEGHGHTLNCPVAAGSGRAEILGAFERHLIPAMESFKPEFIFISAGFDSRAGDPLGMLMLEDEDFADLTTLMMDLAEKHARKRLVSVLEGGYNLPGLASAAAAHVQALCARDDVGFPQGGYT
jgi:acetoin utilization deacetylase AcuC-like enzyme